MNPSLHFGVSSYCGVEADIERRRKVGLDCDSSNSFSAVRLQLNTDSLLCMSSRLPYVISICPRQSSK